MGTQVDVDWPLVFVGKSRPHGRKGQRCKRLERHVNGITRVRFQRDGRDFYVLDRLLVKAEDY